GTILGTPQYMSPEQIEGGAADARTDIFAFGAVLYEMIASRKAFEAKSQAGLIAAILERDPTPLSRLQPEFSAALEAVVKRCLAKDPDERWQTAGDLAAALRLLLEPASVAQAPGLQAGTQHPGRWSRTKKTWAAMAAILGTTTIVLATLRNQEH